MITPYIITLIIAAITAVMDIASLFVNVTKAKASIAFGVVVIAFSAVSYFINYKTSIISNKWSATLSIVLISIVALSAITRGIFTYKSNKSITKK